MSARIIRLADHRGKPQERGREPGVMSILLGTFEFMCLCQIAALYALIAAGRAAAGKRREER